MLVNIIQKPFPIKTTLTVFLIIAAWVGIHLVFFDRFIFHDSWQHNFAIAFRVFNESSCGNITTWINNVDNGSSTTIYLISQSLTQAIVLPFMLLMSCLKPSLLASIYAFKVQIFIAYLVFSLGMSTLGQLVFKNRLTSLYLFTITLFAGMSLENLHSSQIMSILFWIPWIVSSFLLAAQSLSSVTKAFWINVCILLICAQTLDQYPHFIVLFCSISILCFVLPNRQLLNGFLGIPKFLFLPGILAIVITVAQMSIIKSTIGEYQPSLRADLIVHPSQFGETGFLQLTAFLSSIFPITMLAGFENFANGMGLIAQKLGAQPGARLFIFRLDSLLMMIGTFPLLFISFFISKRKFNKYEIGLLFFIAIYLLISLQQTKLYLLLFHLPFFNLFRSYFLLTPFLIFGLLLTSACGFNTFLNCKTETRKKIGGQALTLISTGTLTCAICIYLLYANSNWQPNEIKGVLSGLLIDISILIVSMIIFYRLCCKPLEKKYFKYVLFFYIVMQSLALSFIYDATSESSQDLLKRYTNYSANVTTDEFSKLPCHNFSSCYTSSGPKVSLNLDLNGTFLRNKSEPIFYKSTIGLSMVEKLTGLSVPTAWISNKVIATQDKENIPDLLVKSIAEEPLSQLTIIQAKYLQEANVPRNQFTSKVLIKNWGSEKIDIHYSANDDSYIFIPLNYDIHWVARLQNKDLKNFRANLGGTAIQVPKGEGDISISYHNPSELFLWFSRIIIVFLGMLSIVYVGFLIIFKNPINA